MNLIIHVHLSVSFMLLYIFLLLASVLSFQLKEFSLIFLMRQSCSDTSFIFCLQVFISFSVLNRSDLAGVCFVLFCFVSPFFLKVCLHIIPLFLDLQHFCRKSTHNLSWVLFYVRCCFSLDAFKIPFL